MAATSPGLPPLSTPPPPVCLLGPREFALVELMGARASQAARMSTRAGEAGRDTSSRILARESIIWRQAAQMAREMLSRVDLDLSEPTVLSMFDTIRGGPASFEVSTRGPI